jgi:ribosomal protein L32
LTPSKDARLTSVAITDRHPIIMLFSILSPGRSIASSIGILSNIWFRCTSNIHEFVRPPGPVGSWTKDERNAWRRYKYATDTDHRQSILKSIKKYQSRPDCKVASKEYQRERYTNNAAYRLRKLEKMSLYQKDRYANDPAFRQAKLEHCARWTAVPENRESKARRMRERYANDPDYRKTKIEENKRWRAVPENRETESQRLKERYANDPEFRERTKQYARERYWKKKSGLATDRAGTSVAQDTPDIPNKSD